MDFENSITLLFCCCRSEASVADIIVFKWDSKTKTQIILEHKKIETEISNITCPDCKTIFGSQTQLEAHQLKISNSLPCQNCKLIFSCPSDKLFGDHACVAQKTFRCELCPATFSTYNGVYNHKKRIHENRKDFKCEFCKKPFYSKMEKIKHERVHTNERPFECNVCLKKFKCKSNLVYHAMAHTDDRPLQCEICGKRLRRKYHMKLHLRTHTGEKPYFCPHCGSGFAQAGDCRKHIKNIHYTKDVA